MSISQECKDKYLELATTHTITEQAKNFVSDGEFDTASNLLEKVVKKDLDTLYSGHPDLKEIYQKAQRQIKTQDRINAIETLNRLHGNMFWAILDEVARCECKRR